MGLTGGGSPRFGPSSMGRQSRSGPMFARFRVLDFVLTTPRQRICVLPREGFPRNRVEGGEGRD
uniref:Uncharacterized protein n=1 Tax=Oryza meridionalis TaxID=40149 RepID=A0A0E0EMQ1_9ORYZ